MLDLKAINLVKGSLGKPVIGSDKGCSYPNLITIEFTGAVPFFSKRGFSKVSCRKRLMVLEKIGFELSQISFKHVNRRIGLVTDVQRRNCLQQFLWAVNALKI